MVDTILKNQETILKKQREFCPFVVDRSWKQVREMGRELILKLYEQYDRREWFEGDERLDNVKRQNLIKKI